jgi:hypothetical protein
MAGIIASQMNAPAEEMPAEQMPPEQPVPVDEEPAKEGDITFKDALKFAMSALYENGGAKNVAQSLSTQQDKVQALAETSFRMVEVVDERTQAKVPEEELVLLAMHILQEVIDIGGAAQIQYSPSEVAQAFKAMVLMFVESQGMDASELRAAMDSVDTSQLDSMEMDDEGEMPEEIPA